MSDRTSHELAYMNATEALDLFRRRELAPGELMGAIVARAENTEPEVNAFTETFFDQALAQAEAAANAYRSGTARPLEGLAVAVKEEAYIAGHRATQGSLVFAEDVADDTEPMAERIMAAGGIVHARTSTPEFSMAAFTWSLLHGITRSPWNLAITCGGSSGGSGATLAAGSSTLASGSDIGGSIRIPAAMNGVVGFKPPWGRVPQPFPWNRDHYAASGPMARSVADAALFQNVVSGPVEDDMFSLESLRLPDVLPDGAGMRVALCRDLGYFQLDDEVGRAMDVVADRLREASITVDEVELDWSEEVVATAVTHLCFQARSLLQVALDERGHWEGRLTSYIEEFLNLPEVTASQWQASWSYARHMFAELQRKVFGAGFDALLCPTSTTTAVPADLGHPDAPTPDEPALDAVLTKFMTYPFNVLGRLPVLAMPAGMTAANDVPIGVQIVGPVNADLIPFRIASTLERATGNIYQAMRPQI